ncbi:hypothetical protein [Arsenicicoccus sp. oral taxon 190]|uniref:hypothetical protein n=1 Tax=Arsenicicoccus sp. oral taxon 190 TaxID=1658671 RepID=UPI00067A428E|nr:hypothetical protein [Arsenicicoccus sp. oral taxon 190]AKT51068.1 hypothetical protein ADJ73_06595 [Arsenicicoccus sp. oral taxon 190]
MTSPVLPRARQAALVAAGVVLLCVLAHLALGWLRRTGPGAAPTVNPAVVLAGLAVAAGLSGWAVLGRAQDRVSERIRRHRPELQVVLSTAELPGLPGLPDTGWAQAATETDPSYADPTAPGATAGTEPGAREAWRALWRPLLPVAALAAGSAVLLALTTAMTAMAAGELTARGVRTPSQVTATGWSFTGLGHSPWARVTHVEDGRTITSTVHGVDPVVLPVGTQLTILVDPDDPETVQLPDAANVSAVTQWWRAALVVALVVALAWLAAAAARRLAWRRSMRTSRWSRWELSADEPGRHVRLRPAESTAGGIRPVVASAARPVESGEVGLLAGPADSVLLRRSLLLATPGGLVEARLPATVAEATRWGAATDPLPAS